jgi:hypothetical protein
MHHYGGGYCDIKKINSSWKLAFKDLKDSECYINGYQEIGPHAVAQVGGDLQLNLEKNYKNLIGCCSFICKPNTPFTFDWINQVNSKLDNYYFLLKKNPAIHPQEKKGMIIGENISQYPIPWTDILGNIFHPLCLKYKDNIKQTVPKCSFQNYR